MPIQALLLLGSLFFLTSTGVLADAAVPANTAAVQKPLQCAAFGPYVGQLDPVKGAHPSKALINRLLDKLLAETSFRCIMSYGVTDGLEYIFAAAQARQIKVIAIVWLDGDSAANSISIAHGIAVAKAYPDTIIKLSCGSEVRTRHGDAQDAEILRCLDSMRSAGVKQPLTTIDTWWEWCDREVDCMPSAFADKVDWIGVNIFPWWENKFSGVYPCTSAAEAPDFHIARLQEVHNTYPDKEIVMTEFGWPNGPEGTTETNQVTGEECGIASNSHQAWVVQQTFKQLAAKGWPAVVFEAFAENWKPNSEGSFGNFWGLCQGEPPYHCNQWALPARLTAP